MSTTLILAGSAFAVGLAWGFLKPAGYCSMSKAQQHGFANRLTSGVINGVVLGGIVGIVTYIASAT